MREGEEEEKDFEGTVGGKKTQRWPGRCCCSVSWGSSGSVRPSRDTAGP